jgi:hypothetical protein
VDRVLAEEQTRAAFAQLRADEMGRLIPPGAAGVRRTVRRRRAVRAASGVLAAAVLAVAALAGLNAIQPAPDRRPPVLSGPQLDDLAAQAGTVLNSGDNQTIIRSESRVTDMFSNTHAIEADSADYQLQVSCVGTGHLALTFRVGADDLDADVTCGPAGTPPHIFNARASSGTGSIFISLRPDEAARQRAGFAYLILRTS